MRKLKLEDGSRVPDPTDPVLDDAFINSAMWAPPEDITSQDLNNLREMAVMYDMLTTHPAGTEFMVQKLRDIRRTLRNREKT